MFSWQKDCASWDRTREVSYSGASTSPRLVFSWDSLGSLSLTEEVELRGLDMMFIVVVPVEKVVVVAREDGG